MKKFFPVILLLLNFFSAIAQDVQEKIETISNTSDPESYSDNYALALEELLQNPLDLNTASREELIEMNLLTDFQITQLFAHIKKLGPLISLHELQAIEGFDLITIHQLIPFVKISTEKSNGKSLLKKIIENNNHYLILKYENKVLSAKELQQFRENNFAGGSSKIAGRYRNSDLKDFSIGLNFEKDAGENLFSQNTKKIPGFDFTSGHISLYNKGRIRNFTVGDFTLQTGQGLVWGSNFSLGKGTETISAIRKNATGIKSYTSFTEYGFLRGITFTANLSKNLALTTVYSRKIIDAKTKGDSVLSLLTTGYHRDSAENVFRHNIQEQVAGGNIVFTSNNRRLQIGLSCSGLLYNHKIAAGNDLYNQFNFSGNSLFTSGADYSFSWRNINPFGEIAITDRGGIAFVNGAIVSLSRKMDYSIFYRNFSRDFNNPYANAFRESTGNNNETGIYQGLKITPVRNIEISAYADIFSFPWLRYQLNAPSQGTETMVRGLYRFSKKTSMYLQAKEERKEKTYDEDQTDMAVKQSLAFNFTGAFQSFVLGSKIIWNRTISREATTTGNAFTQDITYKSRWWETTLRFAVFDAKSYDNRVYVYEKDVLYSFNFPAYYGKGYRFYIVTRIKFSKKINLWIRYSQTTRSVSPTYNSPLDEGLNIPEKEIKIQIKYSF